MAAPAITASTRYFDPETTKVYYVASIASKSAPTRLELNAGTDLSPEVADITGWNVTGEQIPTPDLGALFTSQIPGRTTSDDSSLTFYADKAGVDVRGTLPRGTNGFIVWLDGGDTANNKMDVYPIRVRSNGKMRSLSNEAARIQIQFSITSEPAENVTVPA
ncbi:hypothetical protein [Amycolatopsis palatopharyngis]|uniref:phage tail tube protein n=1 Tax=Amycolatopsis palatopharyngis TaxID=187982 RepID=UPI000E2278D5|nr:hypothetical protein [Amycolatopsis palatopharyngis]